jgi:hypothetical protein
VAILLVGAVVASCSPATSADHPAGLTTTSATVPPANARASPGQLEAMTPVLGKASLTAVTCESDLLCAGVGIAYSPSYGVERAVVGWWHGGSWQISWSPTPTPARWSQLTSVSCAKRGTCLAAGTWSSSRTGVFPYNGARLYAIRWSGVSWAVDDPPGSATGYFNSVSCSSSTSCAAVGYRPVGQDSGSASAGLAATWTSRGWRAVESVDTPAYAPDELTSVACTAADHCLAVASIDVLGAQMPEVSPGVLELWNGASWRPQPFPSQPSAQTSLTSIACPSPSTCLVVGATNSVSTSGVRPPPGPSGGETETLADGSWHRSTPDAIYLKAVTCASDAMCMAVGVSGTVHTAPTALLVTPAGETVVRMAAPAGAEVYMYGISCLSPAWCLAVGNSEAGRFTEQWNGSSWRLLSGP